MIHFGSARETMRQEDAHEGAQTTQVQKKLTDVGGGHRQYIPRNVPTTFVDAPDRIHARRFRRKETAAKSIWL